MEEGQSFEQMVLDKLDNSMQKNKLIYITHTVLEKLAKWAIEINIKPTEDKIGENQST